uniref:VWFA domain-containing protein n=1 Tax=Octopus bimaculoides TaxID=37653 RepID=A0A0L8HVA9_OCTBM
MSIKYLLFVGICLGIARHVYAVDLTLKPGETSNAVIDATIRRIRTKCILVQDYYFLRRLAEAQTKSIAATTGGIWRVTYNQLTTVKNACKNMLKANCSKVQTDFGVDVSTATMSDLEKPLHSALVMSLFILNLRTSIPVSIELQADFWKQHITSNGQKLFFRRLANKLEQRNDCASAQIDLVFLIDSSGSVEKPDFEKTKTFLKNIVYNLDISPEKTRVAVIRFADTPNVSFFLGDHNTNFAVRNAIDAIIYDGTGTATDTALDKARTSVFTNTRKSVASKVLVLVTDGKSNNENETIAAAEKLKDDGVTIFTIGVVNPKVSELIAAASEPSCTHFINLKDYNEIGFIVKEIESDSCKAPTVVQKETPLLNIAIPKTNETKQQVLQITNTTKSTLGTTVLVNVQCGVVTVYASFNNSYPNEADYDDKTVATDHQPGELFFVQESEVEMFVLTVLSKKRFDLNSSACDNPSYDISINPTEPELEAACLVKQVNSSCTAKQLDSACYDTTPVVGEISLMYNNRILKNDEIQEQVLEISNSTHSSGSTILVSANCADVTVYGAFNNLYPNEDHHDYKTSATHGSPGKIIAYRESKTDNLALTILSKRQQGLDLSDCDNPSHTVIINPKDSKLEVVCHRKQDERQCTPAESKAKSSETSRTCTSTASGMTITKQLPINAWIYAGLLLVWQMA